MAGGGYRAALSDRRGWSAASAWLRRGAALPVPPGGRNLYTRAAFSTVTTPHAWRSDMKGILLWMIGIPIPIIILIYLLF